MAGKTRMQLEAEIAQLKVGNAQDAEAQAVTPKVSRIELAKLTPTQLALWMLRNIPQTSHYKGSKGLHTVYAGLNGLVRHVMGDMTKEQVGGFWREAAEGGEVVMRGLTLFAKGDEPPLRDNTGIMLANKLGIG